MLIRVPQSGAESGDALSQTKEAVTAALQQANLGKFEIVGTQIVSPTVGRELTSKGTWATVLSLAGILLYIAFRYQMSFAVGAVVATIHDLLVTLAFLAFFRYELSLNVIAAILTVTGYSTNDTIVIFDRVRENLRGMRRDWLEPRDQRLHQSDARTNGPDGRPDAAERDLVVPVRRRSAPRVCVHDDRRRHHGHLFERVRGGRHRHVLARPGADEGRRARAGDRASGRQRRSNRREPRNSRRASRSRSGKPRRRSRL